MNFSWYLTHIFFKINYCLDRPDKYQLAISPGHYCCLPFVESTAVPIGVLLIGGSCDVIIVAVDVIVDLDLVIVTVIIVVITGLTPHNK